MPPPVMRARAESERSILSLNLRSPQPLRWLGCVVYLVVLTLLFIQPLTRLMLYAARSDLHSHILLVPLVSAYLLYAKRAGLHAEYRSSWFGTAAAAGIGLGALWAFTAWRGGLSANDELALWSFAFISFVVAGGFLFLGWRFMSSASFPVGFLVFMVPMPDFGRGYLEGGSMLASADAAALYFGAVGMPVVRNGTVFELPGIALHVAQECSGIHSSWVLFITSMLASHLFLKSTWRRIVLILFVIPLGILRNGFRVFVIGLLCVRIGPYMIDSVIHHRGGPIFFALSLVPLFLLLTWFQHQEHRAKLAAHNL